MTSRDAEWAGVLASDLEFFGEAFTFRPMARVDGRTGADAERAETAIVAAIDDAASMNDPIGQRNSSGMSKGLMSQHATSQVMIDFPTAGLAYAPRASDRLVRASNGAIYEVSAIQSDGWGRTVVRCMRLS
jgi:hypothetical protein